VHPISFVERLAETQIGETFNQYSEPRLAERLVAYLESKAAAPILLVGEAAGYRGARVSGIPFTSERQLMGAGPTEATATIVHRVLTELDVEAEVLLWNVVPTHPHRPGEPDSNRRPTRSEVAAGLPFVRRLAPARRAIAVGRLAEAALEVPAVRHPSHGGAPTFRAGLAYLLHD
jgi:uracil-DNA glycosylase